MAVSQETFARKKPDQLVYLELGSGNGGMLISVSEDGFRFRAVSPLRPDSGVPFAFSLDGKHRLQGVGEVEWLEDDGKSGGLRFTELSPDSRVAIDQWLAEDSRSHSGREATPAAATPLDTMEKIREELRSGYPARPPEELRGSQRAQRETPALKEKPARADQPKPKTSSVPPAPKPVTPPAKTPAPAILTNSAFLKTPREATEQGSNAPTAPAPSAGSPNVATQPTVSVRPPFSTPASEPPAIQPATEVPHSPPPAQEAAPSRRASGSASARPPFTKPALETPAKAPAPIPSAAAAALEAAAPLPTLRTFTVNDSGDVSSATVPVRPYIPPPEDSYDQAWASAKLTAPPESPHLSRAAAGAIIGIALLLIVGALALSFRHDIGTMVIDLGRKISGESHSSAPTSSAPPETGSDAGKAAESQPGEAGNSAAKNETAPASGSNLNSSTPTDSGTNNVEAPPKSEVKPTDETADSKAPSTTIAPRTTGTHPPNTTAPKSATRSTQQAASPARAAKPVEVPPVTETAGDESGLGEFNLARDFLKSGNRQQDLPKAVALLWSGVRKGYVPAEVTLADLYRRGDGVEKNCDQARVLLVAASKKGSPDARRMLEFMAENGCE